MIFFFFKWSDWNTENYETKYTERERWCDENKKKMEMNEWVIATLTVTVHSNPVSL